MFQLARMVSRVPATRMLSLSRPALAVHVSALRVAVDLA